MTSSPVPDDAVTADAAEAPRGGVVARSSLLMFGAQAFGNAGYFVAVLVLARSLGPGGRGAVSFITVTALLVAMAGKCGISETTSVFVARDPGLRRLLLSNMLAVCAAGSLALGSLVALFLLIFPDAGPASLDRTQVLLLVCASVAASLREDGFLLGCGRVRALAVRNALGGWLYVAFLAAAWLIGSGVSVTSAVVGWTLSMLLVAFMQHSGPVREFGLQGPSLPLLRSTVRFGVRAWVGSMTHHLNARLDQVLMGFIATEAALGTYAVAVNCSEVLLYIPNAVGTALLPVIARGAVTDAQDRTLRIFRLTTLVGLGTVLPAATLGPALIPAVFGQPFDGAVLPFLWLLPGVVFYAAMMIFRHALLAISAPGLSSLGPLGATVIGLALDLVFIPRWGASGAAVAATAAFMVGGTVSLLCFRRRSPFSWGRLVPRPTDAVDLCRLPARLLARGQREAA